MSLQNTPSKSFKERWYQISARHAMQEYFRKYLRQELETKPEGQIQTAMLAHMATGSGKTYTIGNFVNYLFDLRKTFMKVNKSKDVPRIHALVLNDRINLINQLKTDFLEGRSDKPSLVNKSFQSDITSRVFHSKSDDLEHEEDQLLAETGEINVEVSGKWGDTFDFSTFQTAVNGLPIQDKPNLIIVDEAHHLAAPTYYDSFLQFYKPDAQGVYPLVLLMSATPDKILHLTGDPLVKFGLPEWIASEYSPEVKYNLVTNNQITPQDIERINSEISRISQIQDLKEKKRQIQILKEWEDGQWGINAMLRRYNSNDELVLDLLERVEKLDHTIIFCPNIEIVDQVTSLINFYTGDENTAIPFHSKIDEADDSVLAKYNSGKSKVIVAVGKLNEGIDMPQTNNVVFWRETESPTIFQQQFGRWLRGDEVNIYDYVWGIRNLAWINSINESIDEIVSTDQKRIKETMPTDSDDTREKEIKHISIVMGGVGSIDHSIQHTLDIQDLIYKMQDLELTCDLTKEMIRDYFKNKSLEEMKNLTTRQRLGMKIWWNGLISIAKLYWIKWNPSDNQDVWYDLLEQIYGVKIERMSKKMVRDYFKDKNLEDMKKLPTRQIWKIQIWWNGLGSISSIYWIKWNPRDNQDLWYDLLEQIYGVKIERMGKKIVRDYFKNKSLEEMKELTTRQRLEMKIWWNGLISIARLYWIKWNTNGNEESWYNLLEKIYGVKIKRKEKQEKLELTKEMVEEYFKDKKLEDMKQLDSNQRLEMKIWWNGLYRVSTLYGIESNPANNQNIWYDLLEKIYGVKIEIS